MKNRLKISPILAAKLDIAEAQLRADGECEAAIERHLETLMLEAGVPLPEYEDAIPDDFGTPEFYERERRAVEWLRSNSRGVIGIL